MNQNVFTRLEVGPRDQHVPGGKCYQRQSRSFFPTKTMRLGNYINPRNRHEFRVPPITPVAQDVVFTTEIVLAAQAFDTMSARDTRLDHHFIARSYPRDELANFSCDAGNIIAEDMRQRNGDSRKAATDKNIEVVQRTGFDFNQDFACEYCRVRYFRVLEHLRPAMLFEDRCIHSTKRLPRKQRLEFADARGRTNV